MTKKIQHFALAAIMYKIKYLQFTFRITWKSGKNTCPYLCTDSKVTELHLALSID